VPPDEPMVIAGPCSAESREQMMATAKGLAGARIHMLRAGVWKPRTRPGHFEGAGGGALPWVVEAAQAIGCPSAVEAATARHVEEALAAGVDALWIGARTTVNPIAVSELAAALRGVDIPVLVKNPINPDVQLWVGAIERIHGAGIRKLAALHRGFSTQVNGPYRNAPIWRIPLELRRLAPGLPLLCDPSHISGKAELIEMLCQNALDLLFDGFMIEVHPCPSEALSDAAQQITPEALVGILARLVRRNPSSGSDEYRARIGALRHDLDEVDTGIVELLAQRVSIARVIAHVQKANNVSVFQPDRWEETLAHRIQDGTAKGLDREFMAELYRLIHEETLRHKAEAP
jgi:chorismate mutase